MFDLKSGGDFSGGEAGGAETGGDGAVGEGAEGGEDGAMGGFFERAWVGKERQMPYGDLVWKDLSLTILLH